MLRYTCIICFLFLFVNPSFAQIEVSKVVDEALGPGFALSSNSGNFTGSMNNYISAQENILSHKDHQYIAFYNDERKVVVGRRNLCGGAWELAILDDYVQRANDRHNHISMGICYGDGTIHLAFDHHADPLNYRVSVLGLINHPEEFSWNASQFGPVQNTLVSGVVETRLTYPVFFASKDGHLNMAYRAGGSGNGQSKIAFYNGKTHAWESVHKFVESTGIYQDPYLSNASSSRNPYHFDYVYDNENILHATWVWREGSQSGYNHDIAYAWSPDYGFTWYNNDSLKIGDALASTPLYITYASPGLHVWTLDSRYGMINNGGQTIDHVNQPHLIARHRIQPEVLASPSYANSSDGSFFHYWRDTTGVWHQQLVPFYGSRTKIYSDSEGNLYMPYGTSNLRLVVAEASDNWANWRRIYQATSTTQRNEHHADRNRLMQDGIFSVVSHEFDGTVTDGPMHVTDFKFNIKQKSKIRINPQADTYVRGDTFSNQNYGSAGSLIVKDNTNDAFDRKIYLRFDLNQLFELSVANIHKAELLMDVKVGQSGFTGEAYDLYKVDDDSWVEDSITWENAPDNGAYLQSIQGDSAQMRWDITQEVISEWNADGLLSLNIINNQEGGNSIMHFYTKEASASGLASRLIISADSSCHQDINLSPSTNLDEENLIHPISLFPNPTTGLLHLDVGLNTRIGLKWEIADLQGRSLIRSNSNMSINSSKQTIELHKLSKGIYLFSLRTENGSVFTRKIIRE